MTKRKKATSDASRTPPDGHLPGPPKAAGAARKTTPPEPVEKPSTTLALAAECMVSDASSLKDSLAALLDEPLSVTLDLTALQRIDTAGLQVITAFVRERAGHGRSVQWQGTAPALTSAAQLLGLTSLLGLPA
jgi:phospholipid transport system transporter-binding protein